MTSFKMPPPLRIAASYLVTLAILGIGLKLDLEYAIVRCLALVALFIGFMVVPVLKHRAGALKYPFLTNNVITVLILFLILDEFTPWWQLFGFGLVASLIKHFLRLNRQPIFNPAAAGLVVAVALGALETWWGASFSPRFTPLEISIAAFLTVPFGLYLSYKYKKWGTVISFLVSYGVAMTLWLRALPSYQLLEGTMLFFAFIMVSEPKTSPNKVTQQVIFGMLVGVLSVLALMFGVASPYATVLIVCNLGYRLYMWRQQKQLLTKSSSVTPVSTALPNSSQTP